MCGLKRSKRIKWVWPSDLPGRQIGSEEHICPYCGLERRRIADALAVSPPVADAELGKALVSEWTLEPYPLTEAPTSPTNLERRVFKNKVRRSWPELAQILDALALEDAKRVIAATDAAARDGQTK